MSAIASETVHTEIANDAPAVSETEPTETPNVASAGLSNTIGLFGIPGLQPAPGTDYDVSGLFGVPGLRPAPDYQREKWCER